MIDKIKFYNSLDPSSSYDIIEHIVRISEYGGEFPATENGSPYRQLRYYKGWRISLTDHNVTVIGNPTKSLYGDNQSTATLEDCIQVLKRLEKALQIPVFTGTVHRLDIPMNFIVDNPVMCYLALLHSARFFSEVKRYRSGVQFDNTNRQLCFYDKVREQRRNSCPIIPIFSDKHVLRYEKRFMKNHSISSVIGVEKATVQDVITHFSLLIKAWAQSYRSIFKKTVINSYSPELFRSPKQFKNNLMRVGMEALGGYAEIETLIKVANAAGVFKYPSEMSHLKTKLKEVASMDNQEVSLNYIKELDGKVNDAELFAYSQSVPWDYYEIGMNDAISDKISS